MVDTEHVFAAGIIGFFLGFLLVFTGFSLLMFISDGVIVNVPSFGSKLCESQGLAYKNYTMMEDRVPQITCTDKTEPPKSIYDGVVIYEEDASRGWIR